VRGIPLTRGGARNAGESALVPLVASVPLAPLVLAAVLLVPLVLIVAIVLVDPVVLIVLAQIDALIAA
jgi:hypothetical protein